MKKTITLLLILLAYNANAQEISPFYPQKINIDDPYSISCQLTYFDMNFISNNIISEFLTYHMSMVVDSSDDSKLLHNGGIYTVKYTDRISYSGNKKLIFTYNIGMVDEIYTVKSVKITGDSARLISFFVEFWKTSINFEIPSGKSDVSLLTGQDVVKFYFNKGKPYITITNSTYKSIEEFSKYFETIKNKK